MLELCFNDLQVPPFARLAGIRYPKVQASPHTLKESERDEEEEEATGR